MLKALNFLRDWWQSQEGEEGQGLVEYGMVIFLVAIAVVGILILLGPQIGSMFSGVTRGLT